MAHNLPMSSTTAAPPAATMGAYSFAIPANIAIPAATRPIPSAGATHGRSGPNASRFSGMGARYPAGVQLPNDAVSWLATAVPSTAVPPYTYTFVNAA
jgi:hypothetical protein